MLARNAVSVQPRRTQKLRTSIELLGFRQMGDIARLDQERRFRQRDGIQRVLERTCNVRVHRAVKSQMAVADLGEAEALRFGRVGLAGQVWRITCGR